MSAETLRGVCCPGRTCVGKDLMRTTEDEFTPSGKFFWCLVELSLREGNDFFLLI